MSMYTNLPSGLSEFQKIAAPCNKKRRGKRKEERKMMSQMIGKVPR